MIALTISDTMEADAACLRTAELIKRNQSIGMPDAICIRNDSFSDETFASMTELISRLWDGEIILESDIAGNVSKALIHVLDRKPLIVGANADNIEEFAMPANLFDCPLCISGERLEDLMDLVQKAGSLGVRRIAIDPMMRNMKQCLEVCTDLKRLAETVPEADHRIVVRTWSGEYAMTMATVSLLIDDQIVIADDLDHDSCETLKELLRYTR